MVGEVESLAVAPAERGGGMGKALLDACRAELRARGVEFWAVEVVESNPAVRLYERAGFRPNYRKLFGRVRSFPIWVVSARLAIPAAFYRGIGLFMILAATNLKR